MCGQQDGSEDDPDDGGLAHVRHHARITTAIAAEPWHVLVRGAAVSATIGWSRLSDMDSVTDALDRADRAMLARKNRTADSAESLPRQVQEARGVTAEQ